MGEGKYGWDLEKSERAVLAGQNGAEWFSFSWRKAQNIVDLVRTEEVVSVSTVQVVIVDIWSTHQQVTSLDMPAAEKTDTSHFLPPEQNSSHAGDGLREVSVKVQKLFPFL